MKTAMEMREITQTCVKNSRRADPQTPDLLA